MNNERLITAFSDISDHFIEEAAPKRRASRKNIAIIYTLAAAACLLLIASAALTAVTYAKPASYISLDVNPSLELCLNRWDRVIDCHSYNDEAAAICDRLELKHKKYLDALDEILCDDAFRAYCRDPETSDLTITIVSEREPELHHGIESSSAFTESHGTICVSDWETVTNAHENNFSVGKYAAYEELRKYDSTLTPEDCSHMTMHELHTEIENNHHAEHGESHETGHTGEHYEETSEAHQTIPDENCSDKPSDDHSENHHEDRTVSSETSAPATCDLSSSWHHDSSHHTDHK